MVKQNLIFYLILSTSYVLSCKRQQNYNFLIKTNQQIGVIFLNFLHFFFTGKENHFTLIYIIDQK